MLEYICIDIDACRYTTIFHFKQNIKHKIILYKIFGDHYVEVQA